MVEEEYTGEIKIAPDPLDAITKHISGIIIKRIAEEYIDPFALRIEGKLDDMAGQQKKNDELFASNVMEAVKKSRRELIEERMKAFDVEDIITKLASIPEAVGENMASERNARDGAKDAKNTYEVELRQLITIAGQAGMVGANAEDRDAISKLIEDRIKNTDTHGTTVNLALQSSGRDKVTLECSNLNVTKAEIAWKQMRLAEAALEGFVINGVVLDKQFKALRAIASVINSMTS